MPLHIPDYRYPTTLYRESFELGTGSWAADSNASAITRDTAVGAGLPGLALASLRWTATAGADSSVVGPQFACPASTDCLAVVQLRLTGATKTMTLGVNYFDAGAAYLTGTYGATRSVAAGSFLYFAIPFATSASTAFVSVVVGVTAATASQQLWVDNIEVHQ